MEIKFNNLSLENVGSWPVVIKVTAGAIIFCSILFLGYYFDISDELIYLNSLKQRKQTLLKDVEIKYTQIAHLKIYQEQVKQINNKVTILLRQLPTSSEIPSLLDSISKIGTAYGLTFFLFKPEVEVKKNFYDELPIEISVTGDYRQIYAFISEIAKLDRIVTLHDFVMKSITTRDIEENPRNKNLQGKLLFTTTIRSYRYTLHD